MEEIIAPLIASGAIKIPTGAEQFTDGWKPENAQTKMEQILTANNDDIQAVLSQNDGMATGAVAALKAQGLDGKVKIGGQDGDKAALNRVALGTQVVSVWKDATELGTAAGEAALELCKDPDISKVTGAVPSKTTGGLDIERGPAQADPDHQGQPAGRPRRQVAHRGRALQGRPGGYRHGLPVIPSLIRQLNSPALAVPPRAQGVPIPSALQRGVVMTDASAIEEPTVTGGPPKRSARIRGRAASRSIPGCSGMIAALVVLWIAFNLLSDGLFLSPRNLWNLSVQSAAVAIMTTGMVLIIVSRNIDLSIGSILVFTALVMGLLQTEWIPDLLGPGLRSDRTLWIVVVVDRDRRRRADRRPAGRSSSPTSASRPSS